jgi:N-acetylglutamate synthase-like GNAT family acetyltransferase
MKIFQVRAVTPEDKEWVVQLLEKWWAGPEIVTRGKVHRADEMPGFIAMAEGKPAGLVTYRIENDACEITSMNSLVQRQGTGTALVEAVKEAARAAGCRRLWLITTNDNTAALRFWQKRGFRLAAVEKSRRLKPGIPAAGNDGIPIRDEIELEMMLKSKIKSQKSKPQLKTLK